MVFLAAMLLSFVLFIFLNFIGAQALLSTCNQETMPHYLISGGHVNIKRCLPCDCLKLDKIKCEESVPLNKCVADNSWIAKFTKFDNFTNDLIEVKCCKYIDHTHTALISLKLFTFTNVTYKPCENFEEFIPPKSFTHINNMSKLAVR